MPSIDMKPAKECYIYYYKIVNVFRCLALIYTEMREPVSRGVPSECYSYSAPQDRAIYQHNVCESRPEYETD